MNERRPAQYEEESGHANPALREPSGGVEEAKRLMRLVDSATRVPAEDPFAFSRFFWTLGVNGNDE